ncbi:MAG: hypothetical protein WBF77_04685 [Sulfurimonadaceae bacterium]
MLVECKLTLQDTLLHTYKSDVNLSSELVEDTYFMMDSFEKVADSVITSSTLAAEFINLLAKEHTFNDGYSGTFSFNPTYGTDSSFFTMNTFDITKTYMLVSSSTRLFVPQTTIKTLFHDNSSLDAAWQRSLDHHQSGNMYLNIYEIEADGTVQRAGNAAVIPAATLANLYH